MACILPSVTSGELGEFICSQSSIYLLTAALCSVIQSPSIYKQPGTWLELKDNTQISLHLTVEVTCWWFRTPPGKTRVYSSLKQQSWPFPIPFQPQCVTISSKLEHIFGDRTVKYVRVRIQREHTKLRKVLKFTRPMPNWSLYMQ